MTCHTEVDQYILSVWQYVSNLPSVHILAEAHAVGFMTNLSTSNTTFSKLAEKAIADSVECRIDIKDCRDRIKSLYGNIGEERERRARLQEKSQRPPNELSYYRGIAAVINLGPGQSPFIFLNINLVLTSFTGHSSDDDQWSRLQFEIPQDILSVHLLPSSPQTIQTVRCPVSRKLMNGYEDIAPHYAFSKTLAQVMTNRLEANVGLNTRQSDLKKAQGFCDETKKPLTSKKRRIDSVR